MVWYVGFQRIPGKYHGQILRGCGCAHRLLLAPNGHHRLIHDYIPVCFLVLRLKAITIPYTMQEV